MTDSIKLLNEIMRTIYPEKSNITKEVSPASAVWENGNEVCVSMEMPGIQKKDDVNFVITTTKVMIKGVRQKIIENTSKNAKTAKTVEEFERVFIFPYPVRPDTVTVTYSKGILEMKLKKIPESSVNQVHIQFLS
jgi:HSP20 family protein